MKLVHWHIGNLVVTGQVNAKLNPMIVTLVKVVARLLIVVPEKRVSIHRLVVTKLVFYGVALMVTGKMLQMVNIWKLKILYSIKWKVLWVLKNTCCLLNRVFRLNRGIYILQRLKAVQQRQQHVNLIFHWSIQLLEATVLTLLSWLMAVQVKFASVVLVHKYLTNEP